jgi:hypothetical protein
MAKGPYVTDDVRLRIALISREHPDWKPATIREELLRQLAASGGWYERNWPSKSTVEKEVRRLRASEAQPPIDERDEPWSLVAIARYEVPPDVLPIVFEACAERLSGATPLTIREALWIARLSHVLTDQQLLIHHACSYARLEQAVWANGRYQGSRETCERLLWALDALTYTHKEPRNHDIEQKLSNKYLKSHYRPDAGRYEVTFKHPVEESNDERNNHKA